MPYVLQDPGEKVDYTFDWTNWLEESGSPSDTITAAVWDISPINDGSPTEPALSGDAINGVYTTVFVNGVLRGGVYRLTCRATTGMGRIAEQSITIRGGER